MENHYFSPISFIGSGSPGGKGSGLIRINSCLQDIFPEYIYKGIRIGVPPMTILLSDVFDLFIKENKLSPELFLDKSDSQLSLIFQKSSFPVTLIGAIRLLSNSLKGPIAIRSSSLTEDSLNKPFAGVFATKMIPNNNPDPNVRFLDLINAVKFVYASTWFKSSVDCFNAAGIDINIEKMAVIIQSVHGMKRNNYFYPDFAGVGRSFNYYPFSNGKAEDGVVELAAGLGKSIVDGGKKWFYNPAEPEVPPPASMKNLLDAGQTEFWAIDLYPPEKKNPFSETEYMVKLPLKILERDNSLCNLCSTYSISSDRLEMGLRPSGFRLIDFSPVLKGRIIEFNELIIEILDQFKKKSGSDIEIEFAVNIDQANDIKANFAFLQIRPMKSSFVNLDSSIFNLDREDIIVYSENALGNAVIEDINDIVYIEPSKFDPMRTAEFPLELEKINRCFIENGRKYILAGFGRWGSSDPALGIPVNWSQISAAGVIIESTKEDMNPALSQGSHFFHNILNTGLPYLSIDEQNPNDKGFLNYDWISKQEVIHSGRFFNHIRSPKSIKILVDGRKHKGIIVL
ncbi:MAG: hypothetical protein JEZ04_01730 [Spirochaetales bacterium]|nr:hypothetical protein [Spirochaetales bacterium]